MWRMFRAGILGVLIGVVGGVIFGQVSYVKNYKSRLDREIRSNAVMYNNGETDDDSMMRIKVDYDGADETELMNEQISNHVGNAILDELEKWLGEDYSSRYSYVEMRRSLNMVMGRIEDIAQNAAYELGADVDSDASLSYEYFDDCGGDCPAGFYHTLNVNLVDR